MKCCTAVLVGTVLVETGVIIFAADKLRMRRLQNESLAAVARYYTDMLMRNNVELTDYDLIALNSILQTTGLGVEQGDRK